MWPDAENTQTLLTRIEGGDSQAIDRLLDRHRGAVRQMIALRMDRKLQRRVDASDIVQEVMIEANRRLRDYLKNPALPFHLWLRQMAKDRLIDAHRRHRTAARRTLDREQPLASAPTSDESTRDLAGQIPDSEATPATAAAWSELRRRFEAACQQLEPSDQELVYMRNFEQLTNSEVAVALGLSPQAASMRYLRAMRRLRDLMSGDSPDS